jgi:hypothetical protein
LASDSSSWIFSSLSTSAPPSFIKGHRRTNVAPGTWAAASAGREVKDEAPGVSVAPPSELPRGGAAHGPMDPAVPSVPLTAAEPPASPLQEQKKLQQQTL